MGTGASFTTPVLTATTTYYVQDATGACTSGLIPVTATATPLPSSPTVVSPITLCAGEDAILTATGSGSGDLDFYDNVPALLGSYTMGATTPAGSFNAGVLAAGNYTFSVRENDGACSSNAAAISITVNAASAAPVVTGAAICDGEVAILTATGTGIQWYSDAALTNMIGIGNSFTTPALTANTDFYATQTNANGCLQHRTKTD